MSKETLRLEIEKMKLQKEMSKEKHECRMKELNLKKQIEELKKEHIITRRKR